MSGSRSLPSFFAVAPMLSTRLTPAGNKTGRSQTVHLCNESSICRFIWGRQTGHIGCLAIWKWKVLLCPYGKPEKTRASNQQLKRPSRTVLTPWFCSPAGQISAGAPRLAPVNGFQHDDHGRRLRQLFQCPEPDDRRRFRLNHDTANPERLRDRNRHSISLRRR